MQIVRLDGRMTRPAPINVSDEAFVTESFDKKKNAADPLKNLEDIERVSRYFINNKKYRDNLIFIMGINLGLRAGDLTKLKVGHLIDANGCFNSEIKLREEKTKKVRVCYPNEAIMDAADLYFSSLAADEVNLNDYLFTSNSNHTSKEGLTVRSVERMLKHTINDELGIDVHAGTHLMRKTFAYHIIQNAPDRSRALEFLQKILGHSTPMITMLYAGITSEEMMNTYQGLNLGHNTGRSFSYAVGLR